MTTFAIGTPGGSVRLFCINAVAADAQAQEGEIVVPAPNDSAIALAPDGSLVYPQRSLAESKADCWFRVKNRRAAAIAGGVNVPGIGIVQSDETSKLKISGAVQMAMIAQGAGAPFSVVWTLADNSTATLDAAQMIGMGLAVGQHEYVCHSNARNFRAQIEAAATIAEIDAIDIEAGWP